MKLLALGVDHRSAPTSVREALAFDGPKRDACLDSLKAVHPAAEFVVLSTCNRVEVYAASDSPDDLPNVEGLTRWIGQFHEHPSDSFARTSSPTTTRRSCRTCSAWRRASKASCWARGRSSARCATPTRGR